MTPKNTLASLKKKNRQAGKPKNAVFLKFDPRKMSVEDMYKAIKIVQDSVIKKNSGV